MEPVATPPAFENATFCKGCQMKFTMINRRHHCRNCGKSFCNNCCAFRHPLPHFGIMTPERTCGPCNADLGLPLLVNTNPVPESSLPGSSPNSPSSPTNSPFVPFAANFTSYNSSFNTLKYDLKGDLEEQCRDAIKSNDVKGVETLVKSGCKVNYVDRSGNSLLHIACIMGSFPIVKILCTAGANPYVQNTLSKPESAFDIAPPSLKHKITTNWPRSKFEPKPPRTSKPVSTN